MAENKIKLGDAIKQMNELTKLSQPFSFSFWSYNATTGKTHGVIEVPKAFIRKQPKSKDGVPSIMLQYYNVQQQEHRHCYICLLRSFNGINIKL